MSFDYSFAGSGQQSALRNLSAFSFLKEPLARASMASQQAAPAPAPVPAPAPTANRSDALARLRSQYNLPASAFSRTVVSQNLVPIAAYSARETPAIGDVLKKAGQRALGGGIPGMLAMVVQVMSLMWMRTTINYQYRHGGTMTHTIRTLYAQGGVFRFYQGVLPALVQGPLSRFGDTAANTGILSLLDSYETTEHLPIWIKTMAASAAAASFRIVLMPVDALKTTLQVEGAGGLKVLGAKIATGGPPVLWHGALAASGATFVGHYPWFATYNYMDSLLPQYDDLARRLCRSAVIGFTASAISDTCSNSIRVIKTTKQTHTTPISYPAALKMVVAKDGVSGLFLRGLGTKIISNGIQGLMFSVLWRLGMDQYKKMEKEAEDKAKGLKSA